MSTIKGKTYGLIIKKKTGPANIVKKPAIFGDDSSDEDNKGRQTVNKTIRKEAEKNKQIRQTQIEINKVLEDDPTAFEYDNVYDKMTEKKTNMIAAKTNEVVKKPKYIGNLLKFAEQRKKEEERRIERQVQKEREEEGSEFADKDSFVTTAYRKKMQALAEDEERQRQLDKLEGDVTKQADLSKFYRNLLNKNVSTGGAFATDVVTKENEEKTVESKEDVEQKESHKKEDSSLKKDEESKNKESFSLNEDEKKEGRRMKKNKDNERKDSGRMSDENEKGEQKRSDENRSKETMEKTRSEEVGNGRLQDTQGDKKERNRTDENQSEERKSNEQMDEGAERMGDKEVQKRSHEDSNEGKRNIIEREKNGQKRNEKKMADISAISKLAKHTSEENVLSARERYLARKKTRVIVQHNSDEDN